MNFTREPIVETIISAREGYKLALKKSKIEPIDAFLVDAVEVITFGQSTFYRSTERPKPFIVPVSDYEILEVRETKMALKAAVVDKGIKISTTPSKGAKESETPLQEKKKERRKSRSKKRAKEEEKKNEEAPPQLDEEKEREARALIPPPTTLISETISRYKDTPVYAGAFFEKEEGEAEEVAEKELSPPSPEEGLDE